MRLLMLAISACLAAGEASAGAWTLAAGEGQVIMTTGRRIAPVGAYFSGLATDDANSSQIFVEYGLTDGWTLGATAYAEFSATDASDLELRLGVHVRHRVWSGKAGGVVSVQAGIGAPVERWLGHGLAPDSLPDSVPEAHLRVLYGRGWQTEWGNSFVSAGGGFQWRGEHADDEIRIEATAGHEAWKGVLGMISLYGSFPLGHRNEATLKLAPSIAYTLWPWLGPNDKKPYGPLHPNTIQLGIVWDALNPDDGLGVQVSVWKSF